MFVAHLAVVSESFYVSARSALPFFHPLHFFGLRVPFLSKGQEDDCYMIKILLRIKRSLSTHSMQTVAGAPSVFGRCAAGCPGLWPW